MIPDAKNIRVRAHSRNESCITLQWEWQTFMFMFFIRTVSDSDKYLSDLFVLKGGGGGLKFGCVVALLNSLSRTRCCAPSWVCLLLAPFALSLRCCPGFPFVFAVGGSSAALSVRSRSGSSFFISATAFFFLLKKLLILRRSVMYCTSTRSQQPRGRLHYLRNISRALGLLM